MSRNSPKFFFAVAGVCLTAAAALAFSIELVAAGTTAQQRNPIAEPFRGVTTNGTVIGGLFPIRATGVSTAPIRAAANEFLAALTEPQRAKTVFAADDVEWRMWNNVHRAARQGVSLAELTGPQRESAYGLMAASLSAKGLRQSRDIMRLNETIGELTGRAAEYGEFAYNLTVMGTPSEREPWGWQLDGHHLIINFFVLGDQVVMTPTFLGSEPVRAPSGKYAGTEVMQVEDRKGLAFIRSLDGGRRAAATLSDEKPGNNSLAQAYRDNLVLDYSGVRGSALTAAQRDGLIDLIAEYVGHMRDGHARVKMDEVRRHLDDTWFAWIGGTADSSAFYYRVQSPVILIEFDHQMPVALSGARVPGRNHIHAVIRTPNGNDYGKDLLRQHHAAHDGDPSHGHGG
jgi:hypothetical protein